MMALLSSIFPGIAAMDNIHPLLVHYPIALFTSFLLAEFLGVVMRSERLRTAASFMLYFGNIMAVFTVAAGYYAAATVEHPDAVHAILERHEGLGVAVLVIATVLSLWRLYFRRRFAPKIQWAHLGLAFILCVVMVFGADLGGLMVYKYGVGGQAVKTERAKAKAAAASQGEGAGHEQADEGVVAGAETETGSSHGHNHVH